MIRPWNANPGQRRTVILRVALLGLGLAVAWHGTPALATLRRLAVGDTMPAFRVQDLQGREYNFAPDSKRALLMAFLSTTQAPSAQAAEALSKVVADFEAESDAFDVVVVSNSAEIRSLFKAPAEATARWHFVHDARYQLWGLCGVIAMPTAIVVGTDGTIKAVKAGYGYDFSGVVRSGLNAALGHPDDTQPEVVRTLSNQTARARAERHISLARLLQKKGQIKGVAEQLAQAVARDPNDVEVRLEAAELYCRIGRAQEALDLIEGLEVKTRAGQAMRHLIEGWARNQMGEPQAAEKPLLEAIRLDPRSARAYFELGKIYHARKQADKALEAYRKALDILFATHQ